MRERERQRERERERERERKVKAFLYSEFSEFRRSVAVEKVWVWSVCVLVR
jgi:hypothetical protein